MTKYQTQPEKDQQKENLVSKGSSQQRSKKKYRLGDVDYDILASGLDAMARLCCNGTTLGQDQLPMKLSLVSSRFRPYLEAKGTPEQILAHKAIRAHPKIHLPIYDLLLKWSWKVGCCVAHTNKIRSHLKSQGIDRKTDSIYNSLCVLEDAGLIVRVMKPLGKKKGSRRLIVPLGTAHTALSFLCHNKLYAAATVLFCVFTKLGSETAYKIMFPTKKRRLKPRPEIFPPGSCLKKNSYPPTPQKTASGKARRRRNREGPPFPESILRMVRDRSGRNPFSEAEVLVSCEKGWRKGASEREIILALEFFYSHNTPKRQIPRDWWAYYGSCAKNYVKGGEKIMWVRNEPFVPSKEDHDRANKSKLEVEVSSSSLIDFLEKVLRASDCFLISRIVADTFEIQVVGLKKFFLKGAPEDLPKWVKLAKEMAKHERNPDVRSRIESEIENKYQNVGA